MAETQIKGVNTEIRDLPPIPTEKAATATQGEAAGASQPETPVKSELFKSEAASASEAGEMMPATVGEKELTAAMQETLNVIGDMLAEYTKEPRMAFNTVQSEALIKVWLPVLRPYMARLAPVMLASMVTAPIVGGKVSLFMKSRGEK